MPLAYEFGHASGLSSRACSCVGHRWDDEWSFGMDNGESFIIDFEGDQIFVTTQLPAHFTGLWRSTTGVVHAAHIDGKLGTRRPDQKDRWDTVKLADALYGVWGLDDEHIYAWGDSGGTPSMFRYDGSAWQPMASPPGYVNAIHGTQEDLLMAVGSKGLIAHFDGNSWTKLSSPVRTALSSVFVVDADEAYACSPGDQTVLEGSVNGWVTVVKHETPVQGVAKHNDHIYVGAGNDGLLVLENAALREVTSDLQAVKFDARGALLISARERVAETTDGQDFIWQELDGFRDAVFDRDPCWTY